MWHDIAITSREETAAGAVAEAQVSVPAESPWFDGHFPGMPLLPGIAQLAMVESVIKGAFTPTLSAARFSRVRFKLKIGPATPVTVKVTRKTEKTDLYSFQIATPAGIACVGNVHTRIAVAEV